MNFVQKKHYGNPRPAGGILPRQNQNCNPLLSVPLRKSGQDITLPRIWVDAKIPGRYTGKCGMGCVGGPSWRLPNPLSLEFAGALNPPIILQRIQENKLPAGLILLFLSSTMLLPGTAGLGDAAHHLQNGSKFHQLLSPAAEPLWMFSPFLSHVDLTTDDPLQ